MAGTSLSRATALVLVCTLPALADVIADSTFLGGLSGTWAIDYTNGPVGLNLQSATIDLSPTSLAFDTAPGGFGSLASEDVTPTNGSDLTTGLASVTPSGVGLDGGTLITFSFDDFTAGESFTFRADVDNPNPTLIPLQDCTGDKGLALIACKAANVTAAATNDARLLAAQTVLTNQMSGAIVDFQFGGPGYDPLTLTGTYQPVTIRQIVQGLVQGNGVQSFAASTVTPEPGSALLCALIAAFGGAVLAVRKRNAPRTQAAGARRA